MVATLFLSPERMAAQWLVPRTKQVRLLVSAAFSPDGRQAYFVQTDLKVRVRLVGLFPERDATFDHCRYTTIREIISVRRINVESLKQEVIAILPDPPWNGSTMDVACGSWGERHANLAFSDNGKLHYDVSGPNWFFRNGRWQVDYTHHHRIDSDGGSWIISPSFPDAVPPSRLSFGRLQIGYFPDGGMRFVLLVDHQRRTVEALITTDRQSEKYANGFSYESAVNFVRSFPILGDVHIGKAP
jgi:hypothetical protein